MPDSEVLHDCISDGDVLVPDSEVLHDFWKVLQLCLQLLECDEAAVVLVSRLKQSERQVVQLLLREGDGALTQTRLQDRPQLVRVDGAAA